ncbi:hypothetical protein IOO79_001394 [Listeria monocytogenes]|nr:hypothetical protein [Listeria monocytogenes]EGN2096707.1 hypothetical protein [Listeria monocytogenes]
MSKKWIGIILLSALFLLVGCGKEVVENKKIVDDKEVVSSKFTGKWKLESVSVGLSDGTGMANMDKKNMMSLDLEVDADGNVKELYVYDEFSLTNSYKIKKIIGNEYEIVGPKITKRVYDYETESKKENVQKALKVYKKLEERDNVKTMKSEQKGNEYHLDTEVEIEYEFSMELESENLILKKVDDEENILVQETYKKN